MKANKRQKKLIYDLVEKKNWLIGAVNYDEDLHFSTYYLRASYPENTHGLYPGYSTIIGLYEEFTEKYYLLEDECETNSQTIINYALKNPNWLSKILDIIIEKVDLLKSIFYSGMDEKLLGQVSNGHLLNLYKIHDIRHRELYVYARLPEALDRGNIYFTSFLKDYLANFGLSKLELQETFNILTEPTSLSLLSQELIEFTTIVKQVNSFQLKSSLISNPKRARLHLPADLVNQLKGHLIKWKYLLYHGYGNRRLADLNEYVERLISYLNDPQLVEQVLAIHDRFDMNQSKKAAMFKSLKIETPYKQLFEAYPMIGIVKLYRRYGQLRNFYYLDMLICEIAQRLSIDEYTIRYMLPEEIMYCLEHKTKVGEHITERKSGCLFLYHNSKEEIFNLRELPNIKKIIEQKTREKQNKKVLKGVVACKGNVVGTCKIIIRPDERSLDFKRGNILVSESTDPDLIKYLKIAGGVLTEQGGVTSHAAIICRELGIPTIIGIKGLLDSLNDGDVIELDASSGMIKIEPKEIHLPFDFLNFSDNNPKSDEIGFKAFNLIKLKNIGYLVPDFLLFPYAGIRQVTKALEEQIYLYIKTQLGLENNDLIAIRSSSIYEDGQSTSLAGEYKTLLNIEPNKIYMALKKFVQLNSTGISKKKYKGALIIQKMIKPDFSGVCLTSESRIFNKDYMIIELSKGYNQKITSGKILPYRIVIDKLTGDIITHESKIDGDLEYDVVSSFIAKQFLKVREHFGQELDIEWAYQAGKLYFLQVRPIC